MATTNNGGCNCGNTTPSTPTYPQQVTGMDILVRALKMVGIDTIYGLVGIPVTELAYIAQERGIRYIGFRHEQQAGMAGQPPPTAISPANRACFSLYRRSAS